MPVIAASSHTGFGLAKLGRQFFGALDLVRVYTKEPNATRPSPEPFIIERGTMVGELTRKIHSALFDNFRYTRIWGKSVTFDGERVGIEHMLSDRGIVEMHA